MKTKKLFSVCALVVAVALGSVLLFGCTNAKDYKVKVEGYGIFKNSTAEALPQTAYHDIAVEHFQSEVVDGKVKKALLLTVDGMRADSFSFIKDYGRGIMRMQNEGGIYLAYAGGEKKSFRTDTAPGTVALMTGKWADEVGVLKNADKKDVAPESLFTVAAKKGLSVKMQVGWSTHITTTFVNEIDATKAAGFALQAESADTELLLQEKILQSINTNDVTIGFYAEPDGAGHTYGFDPSVPEYVATVVNTNSLVEQAIQTVKSRPTYDKEDWLIMISTDHGGQKDKNHHQATITERLIFIAFNKKLVVANYLHAGYSL